jgi:hypothetical protein
MGHAILALLAALALPAQTADYPSKPDEMDKLCEVIGEAPNLSIPPKDRLWFKENCTCAGSAGCGNMGSERYGQRLAVAKAAMDAKAKTDAMWKADEEEFLRAARAERDAKAATRTAQQPTRLAYWRCVDAIIPGVTPPPPAGQRACEKETAALKGAEEYNAAERKRVDDYTALVARLKLEAEPARVAFFGCVNSPKLQGAGCRAESVALHEACVKMPNSALQDECFAP